MQDIYVFPAAHTRTKKKHRGLRIDDLLANQDGDGDAKGRASSSTEGLHDIILTSSTLDPSSRNQVRRNRIAEAIVQHLA
jgi:hypothetical protein